MELPEFIKDRVFNNSSKPATTVKSGQLEYQNPAAPKGNPSGIVNPATGFLNKLADTALDVFELRERSKFARSIAAPYSFFPTGQNNPDIVGTQKQIMADNRDRNMLYIALGIGAVGLIGLGILAATSSKK